MDGSGCVSDPVWQSEVGPVERTEYLVVGGNGVGLGTSKVLTRVYF
jgi:hypothetical protein